MAEGGATDDAPARIVRHLTERGATLACAESLTAGLVSSAIADVPGASKVLRGGVVAYAADLKVALLDVPFDLLERRGTVDPGVAAAMARGVRRRLGATWGVSTTGVAGPGDAEGKPAGTVHVAVDGPSGTHTLELRLTGTRAQIRRRTVELVLDLAAREMGATVDSATTVGEAGGTVGIEPSSTPHDPTS